MDDPQRPRRNFLWWCAGGVPEFLRLYPTEKVKYEGIGGAVLMTGVLAFLSGFYAIYTTVASGSYAVPISIGFGILWGLAIFNLDRYIVASLRKAWLPALPRLGLAILIGITLSKPLELRLFHNAISAQAAIDRDHAVTAKRASLTASSRLPAVTTELDELQKKIAATDGRAKSLEDGFHKEADGTGGSQKYGYSEVARIKESAANQARLEANELRTTTSDRLKQLQDEKDKTNAAIEQQVARFRESLTGDFLSNMVALSELSASSASVWWISTFVTLLLIAVEITPVIVKLMSPIGPYDIKIDAINSIENHESLLHRDTTIRINEHRYDLMEKAETGVHSS
jgi:F0F1-type ATP synthase membrane subunit b/b'